MVIIFATIGTISCPTGHLSPRGSLIWIACWRIVLGIGIGGDYPLSSSVTSDRASLRKRGTMLAYIFSNQGWGAFVGCLVTMATLGAFHSAIDHKGSKVDGGEFLHPIFGLYKFLILFKFNSLARRHRPRPDPRFRNTLPASHPPRISPIQLRP